jgi:hypothetical protein
VLVCLIFQASTFEGATCSVSHGNLFRLVGTRAWDIRFKSLCPSTFSESICKIVKYAMLGELPFLYFSTDGIRYWPGPGVYFEWSIVTRAEFPIMTSGER